MIWEDMGGAMVKAVWLLNSHAASPGLIPTVAYDPFVLQQDTLSMLLLLTRVYKWEPGRMRTVCYRGWVGLFVPVNWRPAGMLPR